MAQPPQHLIIGQIVGPFGTRGELKVTIFTEFPQRFRKLKEVTLAPFASVEPGLAPSDTLDPSTARPGAQTGASQVPLPLPPQEPTPYDVQGVRGHKGQVLLRLAGVESVEAAESLRGYWVMIPTSQATRLPLGSFYLYELLGLEVYTTTGEHIGAIAEILTAAANDVYVVRGPGVHDPTGELLVPAIKQIVKEIAPSQRKIVIEPPSRWA